MREHRSSNPSARVARAPRCRGGRGAGLTEYALGLALVAVVALTGVQHLNDAARDEAANQADCMSERPPPPSCARRPVPALQAPPGPPGDPPPSDDGDPPTPDPDPEPTPPPLRAEVSAGDPVVARNMDGTWTMTVELTVRGPDGVPLEDATVGARALLGRQGFRIGCAHTGAGIHRCEFDGVPADVAGGRIDITDITSRPPAMRPYPSVGFERPEAAGEPPAPGTP
jgi:hypothetical protein